MTFSDPSQPIRAAANCGGALLDGSQIAIGLAGGGVVILSADSLDTMHTKKDREEPIHEVKFSPNGQYLAVGSHDNYIDVYDIGKQYGRMVRRCRLNTSG